MFFAPRSRRELTLLPPTTFGFERINMIRALGVSFIRKLSRQFTRLGATCCMRQKDIVRIALTEATQPPQQHLPGTGCCQNDVCVSGLVELCKSCWSCSSRGRPSTVHSTRLPISIITNACEGLWRGRWPPLLSINNSQYQLQPLLPPTRDERCNLRKVSTTYNFLQRHHCSVILANSNNRSPATNVQKKAKFLTYYSAVCNLYHVLNIRDERLMNVA